MNVSEILGIDLLDESAKVALELSFENVWRILSDFAVDRSFLSTIENVFGSDYDVEKLEQLRQNFASGDLSWLPKFEIRTQGELQGANAAFAASKSTIYFSRDFIQLNYVRPELVVDAILEEVGHLIDSNINTIDTPGDEGALLSNFIQGVDLNEDDILSIMREDDKITLILENPTLAENQNTYRDNLVNAARSEWNLFGQGQLREGNSQVIQRVRDYFNFVDRPNFSPTQVPWSGSFISYIVNASGAVEDNFNFSHRHAEYIHESYLDTINGRDSTYYVYEVNDQNDKDDQIRDQDSYRIKPGDLIGHRRNTQPTDLTSQPPYAAHVDVVVAVRANEIDVIGGNVRDSVTQKTIQLDSQGRLPDSTNARDINGNLFRNSSGEPIEYDWFVILGDNSGYQEAVEPNSTAQVLADGLSSVFSQEFEDLVESILLDQSFEQSIPFLSNDDLRISSLSNPPDDSGLVAEASMNLSSLESFAIAEASFATESVPPSNDIQDDIDSSSAGELTTNFIGEIRNKMIPIFRQLSSEDDLDTVQNLLYEALGESGLKLVRSKDDIDVTGALNGDFAVDLSLGSDLPLFEKSLSADFGLPWLGLEVADGGTVKTAFNYEFNFSFGIRDGQFFFDTPKEEDLVITLDTSIPDVDFTGNLGFLQFDVTDEDADNDPDNDGIDVDGDGRTPSNVSLGVALDIDFSDESGIEIKSVDPTGQANINLELATSFDDSVVLPSLVTDLEIALDLINNSEPTIVFRDVGIGLGSFLSSFVGPVLDVVQDITSTEPLQTIVDLLGNDIPILNMTLIEAAEKLPLGDIDPETLEFIKVAVEVIDIINSIPVDSENTVISFGDFAVSGAEVQGGGLSNASPLVVGDSIDPFEQIGGQQENGFWSTLQEEETRLSFPVLTDPDQVFKLLLGKPADLFELDLPVLGLDFRYESPPIPIFGPLSLVIEGSAAAAANLNFGFDTYGLEAFRDSGYSNPGLIAQGLYVSDEPPGNAPAPLDGGRPFALGLGAGIAADVGLDLGVLRASVEAGVAANIYLGLEEDVPLDLEEDVPRRRHVANFDDLACVFELEGALDAILAAKIRIGFGPFSFRKRITIVRETLVDFRAGCSGDGEEDGAVIEDDDILKLKTTGGNDFIVLSHVSGNSGLETIDVESYSVEFIETEDGDTSEDVTSRGMSSYSDITLIKGNGGDGKDRIELNNTVLTRAELRGGGNDDELIGGAGDDTLQGGSGEDYLAGGKGNDELEGGDGDDFLEGGSGNNLIDGGRDFDSVSYAGESSGIVGNLSPDDAGQIFIRRVNGQIDTVINVEQFDLTNYDDEMNGSDGDDVIDGLDGNDTIRGFDGDDFLIGGLGADILDGGNGNDGTSYINSFAGIRINLETSYADGGEATGDQLISIENVLATIHDDNLKGNEDNNILNGSDGDDIIEGRAGADELDGGGFRRNGISTDEDELTYISSTTGIRVSLRNGKGTGGEADGDVIAFAGEISAAFNPDTGKYEDMFSGGEENYSSFENLTGSQYDDGQLQGDAGNNVIRGLGGNDNLDGYDGNDTLIGGSGADVFDGGEGKDWADYSYALSAVGVDQLLVGFLGEALGDTFKKQNGFATAENLKGSRYGDTLLGDNGDNEIDPNLSNGERDFVNGRGGTDLLIINYGIKNDWGEGITGGFYSASASSGFISRTRTDLFGVSADDSVQFLNIERSRIIGTSQIDNVQGGSGSDAIYGNSGDDRIDGGNGDDFLYGGDGDDILVGDSGADRISGGSGNDTASYENALFSGAFVDGVYVSGVYVDLEEFYQRYSDAAGDRLISIENLQGSVYGDGLLGNDDVNELYGGAGNDTLSGRGGADLLDGGSGINSAIYSSSLESVEVNLTTGEGFGGDAEDDTLINIRNVTGSDQDDLIYGDSFGNLLQGQDGNDILQGEEGNDNLFGNDGSDTLIGGSGNDRLRGSSSAYDRQEIDILTGGLGSDRFYLGSSSTDYYKHSDSYAIIRDFNPVEDTIYLHSGLENCGKPGATPDYYLRATRDDLPEGIGIYTDGNSGTVRGQLIGVIEGFDSLDILEDYFDVLRVRENPCVPILE